MLAAPTVQLNDLTLETLPLSLVASGIEFSVGIVGTVDQTEVDGSLNRRIQSACQLLRFSVDGRIDVSFGAHIVKCRGIGGGVILQEVGGDSGIIDVRSLGWHHHEQPGQNDGCQHGG